MVRRLLPQHILRTRSASKPLVSRSVIVWLTCALPVACDRHGPEEQPREAFRPPTSQGGAPASTAVSESLNEELAALAAEAGLELPSDPLAGGPSGDLKSDVEGFTSLDACVRSHRLRDPLLADTLDALAYDTFTRDACRTLQALKAHVVEPCQSIAFAALRERCQTQVATLTGNPALCPTSGAAGSRDPTCLARAGRDPRLCMAASETERPACRALVTGSAAECGSDRTCARQVERWSSLRERAAAKPSFVTACHVAITVDDQTPVNVDFGAIAEMGAVLKDTGDRHRLVVGRPKTSLWARPEDPWATPQLFLEVAMPRALAASPAPDAKPIELGVGELTLDLLVPKVVALSAVTAQERRLTLAQVGTGVGATIDLGLETVLTQAPHTYRVSLRLQTFVRESAR